MQQTIRVTVWNEYLHEIRHESIRAIYPEGIHGCIAGFLNKAGMKAGTATLREEEHGLRQEVLDNTDVLIWWGTWRTKRFRTKLLSASIAGSCRAWA